MEESIRQLKQVNENASHIAESWKELFAGIHQSTQSVNQLNRSTQVTASFNRAVAPHSADSKCVSAVAQINSVR
jgi:methyl-accepting chemotaxis protein